MNDAQGPVSPSAPSPKDRRQLTLLTLGLLLLFSFLIVQFYRVQVIEGDYWTKKAQGQHKWVSSLPFRRGVFYSHASLSPSSQVPAEPLVIDVIKYHLHVDPKALLSGSHQELARFLSSALEGKISEEEILEHLSKSSRSRRIAMWVDKETKELIEQWWRQWYPQQKVAKNALFFISDYQRSYPYGYSLGHLLHTIREYKEEKSGQGIPTGGLEELYDPWLQGKKGKQLYLRSPRHTLELGEIIEHPKNGADIYLTIDPVLQAIAEEEIASGVQRANAKAGWAILMDPYTGRIHAWAQYPFFDPRNYADFFNDPSLLPYTKTLGAVDAQQPGSVMKPITMAIFLKANLESRRNGMDPIFDPSEKIFSLSGNFKGRSKPFYDTGKHRYLNMNMALQKSSNIYLAKLIDRMLPQMGEAWYRQQLVDVFGFSSKTEIEVPGESYGLVPTPGKRHPNGKLEWSLPTPYSLAIGHNILVSSVQLLRAYAPFANGGYLVNPFLVEKAVRENVNGSIEIVWQRTESPPSYVLEPEVVERVREAMRYTTKFGGTARFGDIPGYTEMGKTGTSEKIVEGKYSKDRYFSTFIGIAPATKPKFILLVSVDEPEKKYIPGVGKNHNASVCCAPVFREIGRRALEYLEVPPDDPFGYPYGDPRRDRKKADWYKENEALRALYQEWNGV